MNLPCPRPQATRLPGRYVDLLALNVTHAADLFAASHDAQAAERFRYLFEDAPANVAALQQWLQHVQASDDPLYFAVRDRRTQKIIGRQALMRVTPAHGVIELGSIYWGLTMARTRRATEAFYLHARYVFDELGYRRLEWKCNNKNEPSKKAAIRFGFQFEGIFRQHMWIKNENRDTAWFAMLDKDWPQIKKEFERWLAPENFDQNEQQITPLRINAATN